MSELVIKEGAGARKSLTFGTIFGWPLEEKTSADNLVNQGCLSEISRRNIF